MEAVERPSRSEIVKTSIIAIVLWEEGGEKLDAMRHSRLLVALSLAGLMASAFGAVTTDPFTTAGNSSSNGFGAPWVNIQPGTLFNQRQVARHNSAGTGTASVGSGAWRAFLPRAGSSIATLTYRQNSAFSPIDLSGIASMSFDITVSGSVGGGYWYLMDTNGFIAEVPGGFALSSGTHRVTLDLGTAAIDEGFDPSKVTRMQIRVGAASPNTHVSVSNLQSVLLVTRDADPFTIAANSSFIGGFNAPYVDTSSSGSLFNQRQVVRFGSYTSASVGGGAWTASLPASGTSSVLTFRQDSSSSTIDLSKVARMSFDVDVTGSVTGFWLIEDENGLMAQVPAGFALSGGTHTVTLNLSTADIDLGFDPSKVVRMQIWITAASANSSIGVSNLDVTSRP